MNNITKIDFDIVFNVENVITLFYMEFKKEFS